MNRFFLSPSLSLITCHLASSQITTSPLQPAGNILSQNPNGGINTRLIDEDFNSNHARGQLFSLPNGSGSSFEITAVTFRKNNLQTYNDSALTLRIFEGTESEWTSGTGHSTNIDGDDYLVDTSVTLLYTETFPLNNITLNDDDYVTIPLSNSLIVNEDSNFGFFLVYEQGGADPDDIDHLEGSIPGRLSIDTNSHDRSSSRSLVYFIHGTASNSAPNETPPVTPALALGDPFQERAILQRDKAINIWGTSTPGTSISVSIANQNVTGTTDTSGNWIVELPATAADNTAHTLTVSATNEEGGVTTRTINNILFGDVWFCFGQSNMRWRFDNFSAPWETFYTTGIANNDNVRCLLIDEDASLNEEETVEMAWLANSTVNTWTAIGSVFAYQLQAATNVPVGIISCGWGSSSIEGWMPRALENELPHFKEMLADYQRIDHFRDGINPSPRAIDGRLGQVYSSNEEAIASLTASGWSTTNQDIFIRTRPNIIYNRRIHPMRNFGIAGFIWYQGEANAINPLDVAQYQFSLPLMVKEYRERFGQGDLPFLGVQLPSHNVNLWPWFRESQDSLLDISNSYVTVTIDTGEANNIHPSDKEEIGVRLSLLAREHALGEDIEGDSPRFASQSINGNQVILTFDNADALTTTNGLSPAGFEVAGTDGIYHSALASISGNTITVSATAEQNPVSVRYAWTPVTHNLVNTINTTPHPSGSPEFNDTGLPLAPFRTDSLPITGLSAQAPFAVDDSFIVQRDELLLISPTDILANDFDLNSDLLEVTPLSTTTNGALIPQPDGFFLYTPEAGFAGTDSFTYQAQELDGLFTSEEATVTIIVEGSPTGYYLWRQTIAWNPNDDQTATGDPDGDGIRNLAEYALGSNPLIQAQSGLPTLTITETGSEFQFNNIRAGISYDVQLSTDLNNWSSPAFASLDNTDPTPVVIPANQEEDGRLFVRLLITETD